MPSIIQDLGLADSEAAFKRYWKDHGFPVMERGPGEKSTPPVQSLVAQDRKNWERPFALWDPKEEKHIVAPREKRGFNGMVSYAMRQIADAAKDGLEGKAGEVVGSTVSSNTPLVFDPEVLALLKTEAPHLARVMIEGQQGFKAVVNRIDARDKTIGFVTESTSLDLTGQTHSKFTTAKQEVDMEIAVDTVVISDFASEATRHYPGLAPLRETALGQRIAEWAQFKERAVLYGTPTSSHTARGSPFHEEGYNGLHKLYTDASTVVDKSNTNISGTDAILRDIKAEIKAMLQGDNAINKADLEIWTSHTMFDELENELGVRRRIEQDVTSVNFGFETISISGVPVIAGHNVDAHSFTGGNTVEKGSEGDVFINNQRAVRFRALAPLFTVPLARRGLADEVAMGEFGAFVDRAEGNFGKLLEAYAI